MAVSAFCAHGLTVDIVGLVTCDAIRRRIAMFLPGVMAIAAGVVGVLSLQREIGVLVFER